MFKPLLGALLLFFLFFLPRLNDGAGGLLGLVTLGLTLDSSLTLLSSGTTLMISSSSGQSYATAAANRSASFNFALKSSDGDSLLLPASNLDLKSFDGKSLLSLLLPRTSLLFRDRRDSNLLPDSNLLRRSRDEDLLLLLRDLCLLDDCDDPTLSVILLRGLLRLGERPLRQSLLVLLLVLLGSGTVRSLFDTEPDRVPPAEPLLRLGDRPLRQSLLVSFLAPLGSGPA